MIISLIASAVYASTSVKAELALRLIALNPGWQFLACYGINCYSQCCCGQTDCPRAGKHPLRAYFPNGLTDAHGDLDQFRDLFAGRPNANLAVRTGAVSNLAVLDLDGVAGIAAFRRWTPDGLGIDSFVGSNWCVATPSGGFHIYFAHTAGIRSRARISGDPIDVRGDGGFVLLPPSIGLRGPYRWIPPQDTAMAWSPMPDWLQAMVTAQSSTMRSRPTIGSPEGPALSTADLPAVDHARITAYLAAVPPAVQGQGGHAQFLKACLTLLDGFALSREEAAPYVREYCARCVPPFTDRREIDHKIAEAWRLRGNGSKPYGHLRATSPPTFQAPPWRRRVPAPTR